MTTINFIIISLGETLLYAANYIYRDVIAPWTTVWPRNEWLQGRMLRNGWCLNRVTMLKHILTSSAMYFASSLGGIGDPTGRHQECSMMECSLFALDRDTYKSKHVTNSCTCDFIGLGSVYLEKALTVGNIPLVTIKHSESGKIEMEMVEANLRNPPDYIAFSHVWSDGRGNLGSNSLPQCEVQRLYERALELQEEPGSIVLFWIDTLCVPSKCDHRRTAIGRMRKTYENASKVLVIDKELEAASLKTTPEELSMQIVCSGWMRRLWTLQEGTLARKLYFQFSEGSIELGLLADQSLANPDTLLLSPMAFDAMKTCLDQVVDFAAGSYVDFGAGSTDRFLDLIAALEWRKTSWMTDQSVCMSILLDLDVEALEAISTDRTDCHSARMCKFLDMLMIFPAYLMFAPGKRLADKSHGWAPASFMNGIALPPRGPLAVQSEIGLGAKFEALRLELPQGPYPMATFFLVEEDESWYRLNKVGCMVDGPKWSDFDTHLLSNLAIVTESGFWEGQQWSWGTWCPLLKRFVLFVETAS